MVDNLLAGKVATGCVFASVVCTVFFYASGGALLKIFCLQKCKSPQRLALGKVRPSIIRKQAFPVAVYLDQDGKRV